MAIDRQHLGGLYKKLGVTVNAELVERRSVVLDALVDGLSLDQSRSLVATVFDIAPPASSLDWFLTPLRNEEPGFAPDEIDGEVRILAASLIAARIAKSDARASALSLAVATASFGGMLDCRGDASLGVRAQRRLAELQVIPTFEEATYTPKADISATYKPAETAGANNQWLGAHAAVKKTIEESIEYTERGLLHQARQLNGLRTYVLQLEDQVQTQWWAIGGWSPGTQLPYAAQGIEEVVVRAPVELVDISHRLRSGPVAAPSLLDMVISRGRKPADVKKLLSVKGVATASPLSWRRGWVKLDTAAPYSRLTPILFALALATESNDEQDWVAQYSRKANLDVETSLSPLAMAVQIFNELLVVREYA